MASSFETSEAGGAWGAACLSSQSPRRLPRLEVSFSESG